MKTRALWVTSAALVACGSLLLPTHAPEDSLVTVSSSSQAPTVTIHSAYDAVQVSKHKKKCRKPLKLVKGKCRKPVTKKPAPTPTVPPVPVPTPEPSPTPPAVPAPPTDIPAPVGNPASYAFIGSDKKSRPAHWNKCSVLRYRINTANATESDINDVNEAFRRLSASTGLSFQYVGASDVYPFAADKWYEPLSSSSQDTDIYIAFAPEASVSKLAGPTIGIGGPVWMESDDPESREPQIVIGGVTFQTESGLAPGFGKGEVMGSLILHELGHVMNLAHVDDPEQLMYPSMGDTVYSAYQNGDLNGLSILGQYPCF